MTTVIEGSIIRRRPWSLSDHLSVCDIGDFVVRGIVNDSAVKVDLISAPDYIIAKRGEGADPQKLMSAAAYPDGWWYHTLWVHDGLIDGVARNDGKSHTDFVYISGSLPGNRQARALLQRLTFRNGDGSAMGVLVQPGRYSEFELDSVVMEPTVAQRDVVLKPGVQIDVLRLRNCHGFAVTPREGGVSVAKVELIDSDVAVRVPGTRLVQLAAQAPFPQTPATDPPTADVLAAFNTIREGLGALSLRVSELPVIIVDALARRLATAEPTSTAP
jgi:hypothetical protein